MDSILPAPELILTGLRSQYIQGVCSSEFGMLVVINLNRMLGVDENKALKKTVLPQLT
jgi:purine-binding chemotaxis protein CheW